MTDQPNVEPPGAELGITLEQARANIGRQVEYVAGDLPDRVAFIERGRLTGVPPSEDGANAFVTFDNAAGAKATPLDRLRLLERPRSLVDTAEAVVAEVRAVNAEREAAEWAVRHEGMDQPTLSGLAAALHYAAEDPHNDHCGEYEGLTEGDAEFLAQVARDWMDSQAKSAPEPDPDESALSELAAALYSHGVAQDDITPSMDENDALGLARVALDWMRSRFVDAAKPAPPAGPSWPQYQPAPYPMQWGEVPPPWGAQPPVVPAEVPDLIEQYELSGSGTPPARFAGERVIYRGRPTDPPLLALVVSVQQSPSGVTAVAQYTVRVPYLGQTLGAYADQLATWHEPEPDF